MDGNPYRYDDLYYERKIEVNDMEHFLYNGFHSSMQHVYTNQPFETITPNYGFTPELLPSTYPLVHKDFIGHDYIDNSYEIYEQNEIKHHFMKLELQFNSSTWQNRPARIYLKGEGISSNSELFKDLNIFSKHLIYFPSSGTDAMSVNFNKRNVNIYKYKDKFSFELQVWKKKSKRKKDILPTIKKDEAPIWFVKMSSTKDQIFCTINCEKGLKVQDLYLIGILKVDNTIYISDETPFPVSSSKRRIMIEKHNRSMNIHPYKERSKKKRIEKVS